MLKVNLVNHTKNLKSNCLNLVERFGPTHKDYENFTIKECSFQDLTQAGISPFEIDELYAELILQTYAEYKYMIEEWGSFIRPGGLIYLTFPDVYRASIDFVGRRLSFKEFDEILRGSKLAEYKSSVDSGYIRLLLTNFGFKIIKHKLEEYTVGIVAEKL